jgi:hypothetical protein
MILEADGLNENELADSNFQVGKIKKLECLMTLSNKMERYSSDSSILLSLQHFSCVMI